MSRDQRFVPLVLTRNVGVVLRIVFGPSCQEIRSHITLWDLDESNHPKFRIAFPLVETPRRRKVHIIVETAIKITRLEKGVGSPATIFLSGEINEICFPIPWQPPLIIPLQTRELFEVQHYHWRESSGKKRGERAFFFITPSTYRTLAEKVAESLNHLANLPRATKGVRGKLH